MIDYDVDSAQNPLWLMIGARLGPALVAAGFVFGALAVLFGIELRFHA